MTQGLLAIVDDAGQTLAKVVCGSDGYNIPELAKVLRSRDDVKKLDCKELYALAVIAGVGHESDLVVISRDDEYSRVDGELGPLYRSTFDLPKFNPRWEQGTADYTETVTP